jgi:hypothetical protein
MRVLEIDRVDCTDEFNLLIEIVDGKRMMRPGDGH